MTYGSPCAEFFIIMQNFQLEVFQVEEKYNMKHANIEDRVSLQGPAHYT